MAPHLTLVPPPDSKPPTIVEGEHPAITAQRALLLAAQLEPDDHMAQSMRRFADIVRPRGV